MSSSSKKKASSAASSSSSSSSDGAAVAGSSSSGSVSQAASGSAVPSSSGRNVVSSEDSHEEESVERLVSVRGVNSEPTLSVPSLVGPGDYRHWKKQMMAVLDLRDLLEVVEKPIYESKYSRSVIGESDEVQESSASAVLVSSVSVSPVLVKKSKYAYTYLLLAIGKCVEARSLVEDVPTGNAHEVWSRLEKHFEKKTRVGKQQLLRDFYQVKQSGGEDVATYLARVKHMVMLLRSVGENVSVDAMTYAFTNGLSPMFEHLQAVWSSSEQSFEQVCDAALNWESKQKQNGSSSGGSTRIEGANAVSSKSNYHGDKRKCFNCHKPGHLSKHCREPKSKDSVVSCSYCGRTGHEEDRCWDKRSGGSKPFSVGKAPAQSDSKSRTAESASCCYVVDGAL